VTRRWGECYTGFCLDVKNGVPGDAKRVKIKVGKEKYLFFAKIFPSKPEMLKKATKSLKLTKEF
jgi:hypothetical protein